MKTKIMILLFCGTLILGLAKGSKTKADGGIFYPPDDYSVETTQKAFIYYAGQTENLVVLTSYRGNAKDFAWVVPTPAKPEINKGSVDLFNNLAKITKTVESGPGIVYNKMPSLSTGSSSTPVEIISEKTVDVYDTAVLKATDENALAKWLIDNGYSFPEDKSQNLKSYVDAGWYFAAVKIKPDIIAGGIVPELSEGTLTPLRLTFQSDKIIYPMKLTGIALTQTVTLPASDTPAAEPVNPTSVPITLYVLADHKTGQEKLNIDWANWIGTTDINKLNGNLGTGIISGQKLFLTKMSASVRVTDMEDDFIINTASLDSIYPASVYKTGGFWLENLIYLIVIPILIVFFPIPLGLIFIVFILLQTYVKKKWLYIIGNIYQVLASLILLAISLTVLLANISDLGGLFRGNGFIGGTISFLALEVLAIYLTVKMIKRYKKVFSDTTQSPGNAIAKK